MAILKLLFSSTLLFLEWKEIKWNGMEGNSNAGHEELSRLVLSYFFSSNILPQVMFNIQFISKTTKTNETMGSIFTDDPGSHISSRQ